MSVFYEMRHLMNDLLRMQFNLEKAMARATSCTQILSDMPKGGVLKDISDRVDAIIEAKEKVRQAEERLKKMKAEVAVKIDMIPDDEIRQMMKMRYLKGVPAENIAIASCYDVRTVYRKLEKGEAFVEKIKA